MPGCGTGFSAALVPSLSPGARPLRGVPPVHALVFTRRRDQAGVQRGAEAKHRSEDGGTRLLSFAA